jgi:CBS domain containing-hemolysin-like protein
VALVAFSSLTTVLLTHTFGLTGTSILIISTLTVLIFGEVLPKTFFREHADSFLPFFTLFLIISNFVLYPIIFLTMQISKGISLLSKIPLTPEKYYLTREDVYHLLEESEKAGNLEEDSGAYFRKAFELNDVPVRELMVHRTEICAVPRTISIDQLYKTFIETKHSKIFVYDTTIDNILGVVYIRDLFFNPDNLQSIMKEVSFVPETKSSTELLQQFILSGQSVAVAVDEFGGTSGIVALDDILEEVIGEIESEYDSDKMSHKKIDENTFILNGRVEIDVINEIYGFNLPVEDYLTVGGLLSGLAGKVPKKNEVIQIGKYIITILKSTPTTVEMVKLVIKH